MLTALLAFLGLAATNPASAATGSDLRASVEFPAGPLVLGDRFKVTVEVTNVGDAPAVGVSGDWSTVSGTTFGLFADQWGDLDPTRPVKATLAPGETRRVTLDAYFNSWTGTPVARIGVRNNNDANQDDNYVTTVVNLVSPDVTDTVGGRVTTDSTGAGLAGVTVSLRGPDSTFTATTGPDGSFAIADVPAGAYSADFGTVPGGWLVPSRIVRVDGTGVNSALAISAVRPLAESLQAKFTLDKTSYHVGDRAKATATLHNTGSRALTGLLIGCDPAGTFYDIPIDGSQWADFGHVPGATLAPGETRTVTATGTVPAAAQDFGLTDLPCFVTALNGDSVAATPVEADVPGVSTDWSAIAYFDRNHNGYRDTGEEVGHVQLALTRPGTTQLRLATTDATGSVKFTAIPTGKYRASVLGVWKIAPGFEQAWVTAPPHSLGTWQFQVVPK
ncbi:carboxypeptidase-like regulatory domain-containing protein [Amycolatopsis sp. NPDC047767]|uniref:carboxypeptidase-like regulatory domain-containing protein n=1 Tax=Amycolatopsis sp. NPDC047767 TaxID=3156765 RepID=UPI003454D8FA